MNEPQLTKEQKVRIEEIKQELINEICPLFEKWDREERELHEKNPKAPYILDKNLAEQARIQNKYMAMIQEVIDEKK